MGAPEFDSLMQKPMPEALRDRSLADLQQAFQTFSRMSEQLTESYELLEHRVLELSGELATVSEQRMQELNEKERLADQLESLLNLLPAGVVVVDNTGIVRRVNPAAQSLLVSEALPELVGLPWGRVIRATFKPRQNDGHEISLVDGRLVSIETCALDNAGQLILLSDQTQTRALQAKLSRHERLTAMGRMVASLAHQIRTPLSAALLYASNLKNPKVSDIVRDQFVDKLIGRLHHLEQQVQDMLIFVKGECQLVHRMSVEELFSVMADNLSARTAQFPNALQWRNDAAGVELQCQKDALVSALCNLITNAFEASPSDPNIQIAAERRGERLRLTIRDQGPGMDAQTLAQIQEPFFTTKSHGTGLGIPVVMAVIRAHQGDFEIDSQPGQGTVVHLNLPIRAER
ncbi:sensor histidine kinase [Saccharospirillum mangrovi]|uniref:sensor histidine kinase n=1 Tax=Saccharospirillum mangrovi TaxID=2161747 RepID=UPI001E479E5E|nr:ATP-binding protein [Saccharospirillum mangrovi]